MLVPAPYQAPEKKAKKKAKGTRGGLRCKGTSDVTSEDAETHSSAEDDKEEEEEEEIHSPLQEKKREEDDLHASGGRGVQEGESFPSGQLRSGHRQQLGVGAQGQAPGQIVSIRTR